VHTKNLRGTAALAAAGLVLGLVSALAPSAQAADKVDLRVVGTSDVSDSNLMTYLKPKFEAAYPQYNLVYSGNATSKAIDLAKGGDWDALIVHAASVENQFVADGWSAEPYGRAIFWGDFVLLGPSTDPAGVLSGSSHDVVTAFEKIAAAGAAGKAHFISRAAAPGTTVQEHAIWAMTDNAKVAKCNVSDALGGGQTPSTDPSGAACPSPTSYPTWYDSGDRKQAANIQYADQCSVAFVGGQPDCYVLTDRGTFQYLASTGSLSTLKIVVRDNDAAARGGIPALVNSFHAYAVNPNKFSGGINLAGATDFLNWITSPAGQQAVGSYLNDTNDAPFLPSAAPKITATSTTKLGKKRLNITGNVSNVVPGTPALDGVTVRLLATKKVGVTPSQVASTTTDANGDYKFSYKAKARQFYTVATDQLTKVEVPTLNPVFADILQPGSSPVAVNGAVKLKASWADKQHKKIKLSGKVGPVAMVGAKLQIWGKKGTKKPKLLATKKLAAGKSSYSFQVKARKGKWKYQVVYTNGSYLVPTSSKLTKRFKH